MKVFNRSPFKPKTSNYRIENKASEATVYLYDEISFWGISAEQFIKDFNALDASTVHLHINSPGGYVFDGTAIYNAIKQSKKRVITHIDGLAASIASVIALAGDEIRIAENAYMMIHEAWGMVIGYAADMRKEADLLDKLSGTIAQTYMNKTGKGEDEIKEMMRSETWMTGKEAFNNGFVDVVEKDPAELEARADLFDLSVFNNVPDRLRGGKGKQLTEREIENVLRDAGCSREQAKTILAKGYQREEPLRDAEVSPLRDAGENAEDKPGEKGTLRDVDEPKPKARSKSRYEELMVKAEAIAPSIQ